jgi:hypothetical protein
MLTWKRQLQPSHQLPVIRDEAGVPVPKRLTPLGMTKQYARIG